MTEPVAPGPVLAEGRSAILYDLGDGSVLRRYRDPAATAETEAAVMAAAGRGGVPVPRVLRAEGRDLVLERVDGPSMLEVLLADPGSAAAHGRTLADLHRLLDRVPAPPGLGLPEPLGRPGRLLHGDLHPGNVLLAVRGPVLVDWTNAMSGPAAYDIADTWLVLACFEPDDPGTGPALSAVRETLLAAFLAGTDAAAAATVLPDVARRRLADAGTTEPERERIRARLRRGSGRASSS